MDQILRSIYYDVGHHAGLSSVSKLHAAASLKLPGLTREQVDEWLRGETVHTLHRQARRNFPRNPVVAHCIGEWCQSDLVDMQAYSKTNKGYKYILTFIDVFSKRATAVPVKSKSMHQVAAALERILAQFVCFNLLVDRGKEFKNSAVHAVMEKHGIRLKFSYNTAIKASVCERFNRTLRTKMHKYFTYKGTRRYVDVLQSLLDSYNHSYHRSIGMRPVDVTPENSAIVFQRLYGCSNEREMILSGPQEKQKFKEGDVVRVRYHLQPMDKSYFPLFTDQTFTVATVIRDYPHFTYKLRNWRDKVLERKFYDHDLFRVSGDVRYRIEKVLKRRGGESLVKWTGYPHAANSWVRRVENHV